jgi:hypothetical protein
MLVTDDRGKRVQMLSQRKLGLFRAISSPIPIEVRMSIAGRAQGLQRSRELLVPMVLGFAAIIAWGAMWVKLAPGLSESLNAPPVLKGALMGLVPSLPLPFMMYFMFRAGRHRLARIIAGHGYCPSCGYHLAGLAAAADRCTVCPECGSAWRLDHPAGKSGFTHAG